ncbi:MAG: aspartate aminotransferase family protein, partial [Solirubrobacteraceae bacterium]
NLYYTAPQVELAERLIATAFSARVFLCNSGAEANECAIKLARKWGRRHRHGAIGIVALKGGFHGRTMGALAATAQARYRQPFEPLPSGFQHVDADIESIGAAVGDDVAAVLLEPIQGESGVQILSRELLAAAREACDEHGAALVFDEVQCGMGRTGSLWAYEQLGVRPDAMTVAKALGGGLPIGALVTGERLADVLAPGDHGSTFAGGPVIAAAALAALELTDDPQLLERVRELGRKLADGAARLAHVRAVRGRGLMLACDLDVSARAVVERALFDQRLVLNATGPDTLRLLPPLIIEEADIEDALARLARALEG